MIKLISRRLLISLPLLLVVSMIVFVLQSLIPGDAARQLAGIYATPDDIERVRGELGLNLPVYQQYWRWLVQVFHGSLGESLLDKQPVIGVLNQRLPVTLSLVVGATAVATIVGVILGVVSSGGHKLTARVIDVLSIVGLAIPSFWLGLLLISFFSVRLGLFPSIGYVSFQDSLSGWASSLALPVTALALNGITAIAKQTARGDARYPWQ